MQRCATCKSYKQPEHFAYSQLMKKYPLCRECIRDYRNNRFEDQSRRILKRLRMRLSRQYRDLEYAMWSIKDVRALLATQQEQTGDLDIAPINEEDLLLPSNAKIVPYKRKTKY
jgi:hypothetical protein